MDVIGESNVTRAAKREVGVLESGTALHTLNMGKSLLSRDRSILIILEF
jgi:hypothetical protein